MPEPHRERKLDTLRDSVEEAVGEAREAASELAQAVKPKLRGWLHAGTVPLALAAGIVLLALSPTVTTSVGSGIFAGTALLLFAVSAVYHRGDWSPKMMAFLRRFDHSNIFLLIAGSYTPFTLILLEDPERTALLAIVWTGAILGVLFRIFWVDAPRWVSTPAYVALGWVAVFVLPDLLHNAGVAAFVLLLVGGALYTVGGVMYALRRPDPWPRVFGYHEFFHAATVIAAICHYIAIWLVLYA